MRWGWVLLWCLLPSVSQAAISISEVAWMGDVTSANHEWIELHNDGEAVEVTGWTIDDGMNLVIALTGTIPAGAYAVLERTSDDTVSGSAFVIYTGALVNTGATLRIKRADGSVVDQVVGGENWQNIGGDNMTKETAQYTSSGWVTAAATPGRGISQQEVDVAAAVTPDESVAANETAKTTPTARKKPNVSEPVRLILPDVSLQLMIEAQTVGYVHQPIDFSVTPSGIGTDLINSLTYEWNFGDGMTAGTKEVTHVFDYPGTYVVTVYGGFKRQEQVARHEITILPVSISLTRNNDGDVQINNDAPYEIDISGYQVSGSATFTFPPRSIMLPQQTITIPKRKLGTTVYVTLADLASTQVAVLRDEQSIILAEAEPTRSTSVSRVMTESAGAGETFTFAAPVALPVPLTVVATGAAPADPTTQMISATSSQATAVMSSTTPAAAQWPYFALAGVLLLGTFGVYAGGRNQTDFLQQ